MKDFITVAIDGPAAAGKSTIAKKVAKILNFTYLDTGAMYRAVTYAVEKAGLNPEIEEESVKVLPGMTIDLKEDGTVLCNGEDVTKVIREPVVSSKVSYIAAMKPIRLALVDMQRALAAAKNVILDGRDIGTYVLPNADVKIFQTASVETRAKRRYDENLEKGIATTLEEIEESVRKRDYIDSHRDFAPLREAEDAVHLDTSNLNIDESVEAVLKIIVEKTGIEVPCH
ncbi:MAG: (d)CMP kinase [Bacilli bacterium]|nr:(d)CMP kinase [Bacilli bacterium]